MADQHELGEFVLMREAHLEARNEALDVERMRFEANQRQAQE